MDGLVSSALYLISKQQFDLTFEFLLCDRDSCKD